MRFCVVKRVRYYDEELTPLTGELCAANSANCELEAQLEREDDELRTARFLSHEAAQRHLGRALELRPGYAAAHTFYGQMLGGEPLLRLGEARLHPDRGRELDPLSLWNDINLVAWWLWQTG
jgi:hypothetical protein